MKQLRPLSEICVPPPQSERTYTCELFGRKFAFAGLRRLLAAADIDKAGDRNAQLAAGDDIERETARQLLSGLTVEHLYNNPLTAPDGRVDEIMRVNYDIDLARFETIKKTPLGALKDALLKSTGSEIEARYIGALTGVHVAALAKLMDTHELIFVAKKIRRITKARTTLGQHGVLGARLQPNHPTDDLRGLTALVYLGLSLGSGDCLIGINPAIDTVDNISKILRAMCETRERLKAPTQVCVLSHIKTQIECLEQGAPVEIMFQSLAGTEATNLSEFDLSVETLDRGYNLMAARRPDPSFAQFMYFETGQGSEFTYGKHNGTDMATLEALCYGLARRYDPYMVNNVTGFIGPETHADNFEMVYSCLQDHFMGKMMGLPMGMAPCFTLHSQIGLEGQQMATQLLTAAGANFYMDVYLNTDRMLAYFDTSAHDNQTLREIYDKRPTPEFLAWAIERGIYALNNGEVIRGPTWGNPRQFVHSESELDELLAATPAVYGLKNAGPRPVNQVSRKVRADRAMGKAAIYANIEPDHLSIGDFELWNTAATSKAAHLNSPSLGAKLGKDLEAHPTRPPVDVQVLISDGLSAAAVHANVNDLFPVLADGLRAGGWRCGKPIVTPYGRVKLAEPVAALTNARLVMLLIGERPGGTAEAATSLSCYLVYKIDADALADAKRYSGNPQVEYEYSVVSNIYAKGLHPIEAGSVLSEMADKILRYRAAGNRLESLLSTT